MAMPRDDGCWPRISDASQLPIELVNTAAAPCRSRRYGRVGLHHSPRSSACHVAATLHGHERGFRRHGRRRVFGRAASGALLLIGAFSFCCRCFRALRRAGGALHGLSPFSAFVIAFICLTRLYGCRLVTLLFHFGLSPMFNAADWAFPRFMATFARRRARRWHERFTFSRRYDIPAKRQ